MLRKGKNKYTVRFDGSLFIVYADKFDHLNTIDLNGPRIIRFSIVEKSEVNGSINKLTTIAEFPVNMTAIVNIERGT